MKKLTGITSDPIQEHRFIVDGEEVIITLRFYPTIQAWCFDVEYLGRLIKGVKASLGVWHLKSSNFPFDFTFIDTSKSGIDPRYIDDFETGRVLFVLDQLL